jgi:hypothetical protein
MKNDQPNDDGEHITATNVPLQLCSDHTKETWIKSENYKLNSDNSITCKKCGWGTFLPGYMRFILGKVVDLRSENRL